MESKRVLWIVAAVGLFLLVVIGTALLLYAPLKYKKPTSSQFVAQDGAWVRPDMIDYSTVKEVAATTEKSGSTTESSAPAAAQNTDSSSRIQNLTVYADNTNIYSQNGTAPQTITIPLTGTGNADTSAPAAQTAADTSSSAGNSSQSTAQSSAKPASVPTSSTAASSSASSSSAGSSNSGTKPASTAAASSSAASSAGTSSGSGKTTSASKPAQTALPDQFWVQVASFTSKKNAEDARSVLAKEQISGEVFTWTHSDGTIYYRLRVGPYTTENEAEYWHARIKLIDIFANTSTYVTNSSGKAPN
ncbi:MAG: SPOR domain-containing protein [Treponemataceae bacterium]|nr:SPOR domain-containing protein [Treponemataceae bacterium]